MRFIFSTNKIVIRVQIKIIRNREKIILEQMSNFIKKNRAQKMFIGVNLLVNNKNLCNFTKTVKIIDIDSQKLTF